LLTVLGFFWRTDCGALAYTDAWVHSMIAANEPSAPGGPWKPGALAWAEAIAYLPFSPAPAPVGPPPGVAPAPVAEDEGKVKKLAVLTNSGEEVGETMVEDGVKAKKNGFKDVKAMERERVERSVRQDVLYLKTHPLIKESVLVTGWVFDLHTGKVVEVDC
jgi:hypothetical protein